MNLAESVVIDSCVMHRYIESLITEKVDAVTDLIACVLNNYTLAMDEGGKIQHQWLETCGHQVFGEYLYGWIREGKIELFDHRLHEQHKKHLSIKCGFPFHERQEGVFVGVASVAFPHILVGDDIDFWEPTEKGCSEERRTSIMENSRGQVCKYLQKKLGIQVVTINQAIPILCPLQSA